MATASKDTVPIFETVQVHTGDVVHVTLTLTDEEAEVLQLILTLIGGSPHGPRGKANAIARALHDVLGSPHGVGWDREGALDEKYPLDNRSRAIYFTD